MYTGNRAVTQPPGQAIGKVSIYSSLKHILYYSWSVQILGLTLTLTLTLSGHGQERVLSDDLFQKGLSEGLTPFSCFSYFIVVRSTTCLCVEKECNGS